MNLRYAILTILSAAVSACAVANDVETVERISDNRTLDTATDLHVTSADSSLLAQLDVTNDEAFLYFDNVRPNVVLKKYGDKILIKGQKMVPDTNCRLSIYGAGTVITPRDAEFQPLTTYTSDGFKGDEAAYSVGLYYSNSPADGVDASLRKPLAHDNAISSFVLKRGYMATLAAEPDGLGYSRCYIADKEDLKVSQLPKELHRKVSFVRVFKWNDISKKGWVGSVDKSQTGCKYVVEQTDKVNGTWFYNWSPKTGWTSNPDVSEPNYNMEFVPEKWGYGGESDWLAILNNTTSSHLNGYNEPDHTEQSNVSVERAIEEWPRMLQSGMRVGSPATTSNTWLFNFVRECKKKNYRVDYVNIHAYWGGMTGDDWYSELKKVHEATGLPIWITEWNNGANWTNESWPSGTSAQQQHQLEALKTILNVLDTCSFVERYSIYNWVEDKRALMLKGSLTPAGEYYAANKSQIAYRADMQVVPQWNVNTAPSLSLGYSAPDKSVVLGWSDPNGEQISGFALDRDLGTGQSEAFRTSDCYASSYSEKVVTDDGISRVNFKLWSLAEGGDVLKGSNSVGYNVVHNDVDKPNLFDCIIDHDWELYALSKPYKNRPLALFGMPTDRIKTAITFRAKGIDECSLLYRLKNWTYQGDHSYNYPDTVPCVLMNAGEYRLDGMTAVADSICNVGREWKHVSFAHPFTTTPVVVASPMTSNNKTAFVVKLKAVTTEGFDVALQYEEADSSGVDSLFETISYMAANEGMTEWNNLQIEVGTVDEIGSEREGMTSLNLKGEYLGVPTLLGSFQDTEVQYACYPRIKSRTAKTVTLFGERETSASNALMSHEKLGYIAIGTKDKAAAIAGLLPDEMGRHTSVYSLSGNVMMSEQGTDATVLNGFPKGVYIVREGDISHKIIVK